MFSFIQECIKTVRGWLFLQLLVCLFWAIDLSVRPYIFKLIVDNLTSQEANFQLQYLSWLLSIYLLMSFLVVVIFRLYDWSWLKINPSLKRYIANRLMLSMIDKSHLALAEHFAGNVANKIKDVMSGVPDLIKLFIDSFFSNFVAIAVAMTMLSTISYKFSFLLFIWIVVFSAGSYFFAKMISKLCINASNVRSRVVGKMVDIIQNIFTIKLFNLKKRESQAFCIELDAYVKADQKRDLGFLFIFLFQGLSYVIYQAVSFLWLFKDFKMGLVSPGDFALLLSLNISIISSLWHLSGDFLKGSDLVGNISAGLQVAQTLSQEVDKEGVKSLKVTQGTIKFDKVKFSYHSELNLFSDKSITIEGGQKVGLVGFSGSGKTTFVNLILRMMEPQSGSIKIDDQDIGMVTYESLREAVAFIPQDPSLFHRSICDNIDITKSGVSLEKVREAAVKAHADEFIEKLPLKYLSIVGERGVKLSGGERQRIAISRAFLKNAPILILDEATSQLDSLTESLLQDSFKELMKNKTTIVVAHRLSTLLVMDRILVFNQGKIVQDGTHDVLVKEEGLYKKLWDAQVGGFLMH